MSSFCRPPLYTAGALATSSFQSHVLITPEHRENGFSLSDPAWKISRTKYDWCTLGHLDPTPGPRTGPWQGGGWAEVGGHHPSVRHSLRGPSDVKLCSLNNQRPTHQPPGQALGMNQVIPSWEWHSRDRDMPRRKRPAWSLGNEWLHYWARNEWKQTRVSDLLQTAGFSVDFIFIKFPLSKSVIKASCIFLVFWSSCYSWLSYTFKFISNPSGLSGSSKKDLFYKFCSTLQRNGLFSLVMYWLRPTSRSLGNHTRHFPELFPE